MNIKLFGGAFALLFLISCGGDDEVKVMPPQEISVVKVIEKDVPIYNNYVAQIYGAKDIPIRARVEGFLEGISFDEGKSVKEGQLLYVVDSQPFVAEVNAQKSKVAEAQTGLVKAKADLDRIKPLAEQKAVSESDLDAAQAQYDAAKAALKAAEANVTSAEINLSYTQIKSPINGVIGITRAKVGEFVGREPNPVILNMVSSINHIIVKFNITEAEYLMLAREYKENEKGVSREENKDVLELLLSDGSFYKHKGKFDAIDAQVDPNTGSILVQAIFPNPDKLLRPGMYAKVIVQIKVDENALVIPQRCLTELQGQYSVFVVNDSNQVQSRAVNISHKIGDLCIVEKGLQANEKLVIDGLQKVRNGVVISPQLIEFKSQN